MSEVSGHGRKQVLSAQRHVDVKIECIDLYDYTCLRFVHTECVNCGASWRRALSCV